MHQTPVKAVPINPSSLKKHQTPIKIVLCDEDGGSIVIPEAVTPAAVQAASTATDVAGLKADVNALLVKLKAAGLMAES